MFKRRKKHKKWVRPDTKGMKYAPREQKVINHSELVDMVAAYSNYFSYEVEDILHFLAIAIEEEIAKGNRVRLKGVGYFRTKKPYTRTFYSAMLEKRITVTTKVTPVLSADSYMLHALNPEVPETDEEELEDASDIG